MHCFTPLMLTLSLLLPTSPITIPQDFILPLEILEVYEQDRSNGNRQLITSDVALHIEKRDNLMSSVSCIQSYLNQAIPDPARCILVVMDDDEEDTYNVAQPFVVWLKGHYAFSTHSPLVDSNVTELASSAILLMPRGSSLQSVFYILDPCDRGCLFVVILLDSFEDEDSFLSDAAVVSEAMWSRRLSIVSVLGKVGNNVLAAGSFAFEPDNICTPYAPEVMGRCKNGRWSDLKLVGPLQLNGCYLKIAYLLQPPYVIAVNGSDQLKGFEGILIDELSKDFKFVKQQVDWGDNTSYADQIKMMLYDETKADIVIGRILQSPDEDIEYSTTYDMVKLVWLIPKIPEVSLKGLIRPFETFVWAAIGGTVVLGIIFKVFLLPDVSGLDIFALIIGVAVYRQPTRFSRRIHFIGWSIFGLFLAQLYIDSLADQLINLSSMRIDNMQELLASSIKVGGTLDFVNVIESFDKNDEFVSVVTEEIEVFDHGTYMRLINNLLSGENASFALIVVLNSSRSETVETANAYTMTNDVICSFPLAMATWKGFPVLHTINNRVQQLIDYGMFDFMVKRALENDTRARLADLAQNVEYKSNLHLQQFLPVFLLMSIGFAIGFIILIMEIVLHPWKMLE